MSELIMSQRTSAPNTPGSGKVSMGYNSTTGRWESKLPNGDTVLFQSDYGKQIHIAQRVADVATTSGSPTDYQTLNLTGLEIGKVYQVNWSWVATMDSTTDAIAFRLLWDSTNLAGFNYQEEPKDAANVIPSMQEFFIVATASTATLHAQFARIGTSGTCTMKRSTLRVINTGLTSIPTGEP